MRDTSIHDIKHSEVLQTRIEAAAYKRIAIHAKNDKRPIAQLVRMWVMDKLAEYEKTHKI